MYVIATVFCSNFHFSVSLHVPFSQFLFERDSYSNEYLLLNFLRQYSRGRVSQSLPKNSKQLEGTLEKTAKGLGKAPGAKAPLAKAPGAKAGGVH